MSKHKMGKISGKRKLIGSFCLLVKPMSVGKANLPWTLLGIILESIVGDHQ
jgi:hypothetical protein